MDRICLNFSLNVLVGRDRKIILFYFFEGSKNYLKKCRVKNGQFCEGCAIVFSDREAMTNGAHKIYQVEHGLSLLVNF